MGKKHGRVPNVLWRQFGDKARTLAKTIISLIPRDCNCNAKGKCLRCIFGDGEEAAMSCLIRPHDPSNYRDFMTTCFVVIPHDAPPISALLGFTRHWSQLQVLILLQFSFFCFKVSVLINFLQILLTLPIC